MEYLYLFDKVHATAVSVRRQEGIEWTVKVVLSYSVGTACFQWSMEDSVCKCWATPEQEFIH